MKCDDIMGVVVYDLPGRDCHALASNGELATGQLDRYKSEYIDGESYFTSHLRSYPGASRLS